MLISGIFGVILYFTIAHTFPRLGALTALLLIIIGQLIMGMIIDHFGWFGAQVRPVDASRLVAVGLMLAASYLMVR
jgi:transporter family-2 protein